MYLAQTNTIQTQAPFYVNILQDLISGEKNEEKNNIDSAIQEAIEIAKHNRDIFSINNEHYFLVTTLLSKYKDNLIKLSSVSVDASVYKDILSILK